jgi:hypothetical protein
MCKTVINAGISMFIIIKQEKGLGYIKTLHLCLFSNSNEDYLFPIHREAGSMELELDIASKASILRAATEGVDSSANKYEEARFEISNVKFVFSLLSVSDEFLSKYKTMSNNNELVLLITTFQRQVSKYSASEVEPAIFINSAKKDVRRACTVLNKMLTTIQAVPAAGKFVIQQPSFVKGTGDGDQICTRFIHKYQD